jgi:hypothetical protein
MGLGLAAQSSGESSPRASGALVARSSRAVHARNSAVAASRRQGAAGKLSHPVLKPKLNAHSMCAQESSLHMYRTENRYMITNVTIYNIFTK